MDMDNNNTNHTCCLTYIGFNLKSHYNHVHDKQKSKTNVQINNKNVKLYRDISYGKGMPNSKLDIITPADMSNDTKLPVIFDAWWRIYRWRQTI